MLINLSCFCDASIQVASFFFYKQKLEADIDYRQIICLPSRRVRRKAGQCNVVQFHRVNPPPYPSQT